MLIHELQRAAADYGCSLQEEQKGYLIFRDSRFIGQIVGQEFIRKVGETIDSGLLKKFCTIFEMYDAFENAQPLEADGLERQEGYRLLAEYNHIVLAMKDSYQYRPECVTWGRSLDGKNVFQGHYYAENYDAAKKDFAVRSGLISKDELFSKEELTAISHAIDCVQEMGDFNDIDEETVVKTLSLKLPRLAPELSETQEPSSSQQL